MNRKVGKRKRKGWRRKCPKCTMCTFHRWLGNSRNRFSFSYYRQQPDAD